MKIGVYLVDSLAPSAGGNFSYYDTLIRGIDAHDFDKALKICFVGRLPSNEVNMRKPYHQLSSRRWHRIFQVLGKTGILRLLARIFSTNADLCNRRDIRLLKNEQVDVLLFPKQFFRDIDNFPFMTMNWDAGHKSTFAFPEFLDGIETRELWFRMELLKALSVIVESQASKIEFSEYFAIPKFKIEIVPLFPGGVIEMSVSSDEQQKILQLYQLEREAYFFYPAQFWAHKNHYTLVHAFNELVMLHPRQQLKLVLTGSDKGNKEYIRKVIADLRLQERVMLLGFVSNEAIYTFYKNALALLMPTFLGPTNMPVLEAQALGTAVICSDLSGHRETCGEAAIYVHPAEQQAWTKAMNSVLDPDVRQALLAKAAEIRGVSEYNIKGAIKRLEEIFIKYIPIRKTFS